MDTSVQIVNTLQVRVTQTRLAACIDLVPYLKLNAANMNVRDQLLNLRRKWKKILDTIVLNLVPEVSYLVQGCDGALHSYLATSSASP
jgi:hypothetical protein